MVNKLNSPKYDETILLKDILIVTRRLVKELKHKPYPADIQKDLVDFYLGNKAWEGLSEEKKSFYLKVCNDDPFLSKNRDLYVQMCMFISQRERLNTSIKNIYKEHRIQPERILRDFQDIWNEEFKDEFDPPKPLIKILTEETGKKMYSVLVDKLQFKHNEEGQGVSLYYPSQIDEKATETYYKPLIFLKTIEKTLRKGRNKEPKYPGNRWPRRLEWRDLKKHVCFPRDIEDKKIISRIINGELKRLLLIGESAIGKSVGALFIGERLRDERLKDKRMSVFYLNIGELSSERESELMTLKQTYEEISYIENIEKNTLIILDDLHRSSSLSLKIIKQLSKCKSNFIMTSRDTIVGHEVYEKIICFLKPNGEEIALKQESIEQVVQWLLGKNKTVPTTEIEKESREFIEEFENLALICCALSRWKYGMEKTLKIVIDRALDYLEKIDQSVNKTYSAREIIYCICALWQYEIATPVSLFSLLDFNDEIIKQLTDMDEISKEKYSRRYKIEYHPQTAKLFIDAAEEDDLSDGLKGKIMEKLKWESNKKYDLSSLVLIFTIERELIQKYNPFEELHNHVAYQGKNQREKFTDMLEVYLEYQEYREKSDEKYDKEIAIWVRAEYGDMLRRKDSIYFENCKLQLTKAKELINSSFGQNSYMKYLEKYMGRILYNLAYIEYLQNNFIIAEELFQEAEKFAKDIITNKFSKFSNKAQGIFAHWRQYGIKENKYCLDTLFKVLKDLRSLKGKNKKRWIGNILCFISEIYIEKGLYDNRFYNEAEKKMREAMVIFKEVAPLGLPTIQLFNGILYNKRGNFNDAIGTLENILEQNEMERRAIVYLNLGIAYKEKERIRDSIKLYYKALETCDPGMDNIEDLLKIVKELYEIDKGCIERIEKEPEFINVRNNPKFVSLLRLLSNPKK